MAGQPFVSVIIVSYNVRELLLDCIRSVHEYLTLPFEIIVTDNNSSDGSVEAIRNEFPSVTVIANKHNPGFSIANNQGLELATGEFIFFLNPDTELRDDSISRLLQDLKLENEDQIIAGPMLLNSDGSFQESCWRFPNPIHHISDLMGLNRLIKPGSYRMEEIMGNAEVDFLSGAALLLTASNARRLAGFDKNLFWMEDVDLCKRNKAAGGRNVYFPTARLLHHSGQSGKQNYKVQISNQVISKLKYYRKHRQYFDYFLSIFIFFLQIITRIPVFLIFSPINNTFFKKCKAYVYTLNKFFQYLFLNSTSLT